MNEARRLLRDTMRDATGPDGALDCDRLMELLSASFVDARLLSEQQAVRFSAVLDNMVQGVCLFDAEQRLIACNARYAKMYGLRQEDVLPGLTLHEIMGRRYDVGTVPAMTRADYLTSRDQVMRSRLSSDSVIELRDGTVIAIRHVPLPDGGWIATHEDITERRRVERQVAYMASYDGLTGLPNNAALLAFLDRVLPDASPLQPCALLSIDLDRFRRVNDTMGRPRADELIRVVADRLRKHATECHFLARPGGDEFVVVQTCAGSHAGVTRLAEKLLRVVAEPIPFDDQQVMLSATIGIAVVAGPAIESEWLLSSANMARHQAKLDGRGTYRRFTSEMEDAAKARSALERDLRHAVEQRAFEIDYQPQINLTTQRVTAFEALLRWRHPVRGDVPPAEFIPLAEETGLIGRIGKWAMEEACREAANWPEEVCVAVNVSARQLAEGSLPGVVAGALRAAGLPAARLELEITESALMENSAVMQAALRVLRQDGTRIAIDDFGVGYSSLSYLTSFPFDKIKIDRSFVSGSGRLRDRQAVVRAVVGLCGTLGMTCAAEGLETASQLDMLLSERCAVAQGYLFGRPVPATEIGNLLRIRNPTLAPARSPGLAADPARAAPFISFFQIAETVNDIVIVTTPDLDPPGPCIVYVNPAFTRLTGYSAAEAIGRSPRFLQGPGTSRATLDTIAACLQAGEAVHEKVLNYSKSGAPYWLDLRIAVLRDAGGVVTHFVGIERDVTLDKRRLDELEFAADRDTLTGVANRRALLRVAEAEIDAPRGLCLAFIDVDRFKQVNDTLGHAAGDAVLFGLADRLVENVRRSDTVGRLGGEEFAVCLPGVTLREAQGMAERLRGVVAASSFPTLAGPVSITVSIGVAAREDGDDLARLVERADAAMYAAKRDGRDRVAIRSEGP